MAKTILVTGPIGSGKSAACQYLASLDFPVYECDARTKMLYSLVPGLKCSIEERLNLPWSQIGRVFSEPDKLRTLEEMVYPYVVEDLKTWKASFMDHTKAFMASPEGAVNAMEARYAFGKDISKYQDSINSITPENIKSLLKALASGGRIEFIADEQ